MIPVFPVYIFDLDGTLLDSATDICGTASDVLASAGYGRHEPVSLRRYIGLHLGELFRNSVPGITESGVDELVARYREQYFARDHASTSLYAGAHEVLMSLPGRKAIATSRRLATAKLLIERFGLSRYFDHVQGIDGIRSKPAPDILLACIGVLGVSGDDCLFVGDSPADLDAGRRAGVKTCLITHGYGDADDLRSRTPDYVVPDLWELIRDSRQNPTVTIASSPALTSQRT